MSHARDVLGYCDEPSPNTAPDATTGVWCTLPIGHAGGHLYYGIDCWSEAADRCVCDPAGPCLGVPGESDACGACLVLDPEAPCLHDPELVAS